MLQSTQNKITQVLDKSSDVSLTADIWTDRRMDSFLGVTVHGIVCSVNWKVVADLDQTRLNNILHDSNHDNLKLTPRDLAQLNEIVKRLEPFDKRMSDIWWQWMYLK